MQIKTLLISLPILAAGPIVTLYLYTASMAGKAEAFPFVVNVLIVSGVAAAVSTIAQLKLKRLLLTTVVSVPISEIICVLLLLVYIFCMSDNRERAEAFMWLPVIILFLIPWMFPTVLAVSFGTGMIVRDFEESNSKRSQNLAKTLIERDDTPAGIGKKDADSRSNPAHNHIP